MGSLSVSTGSEFLEYPASKRGEVVEVLHGVKVADPYRWLEDLNSEETGAWVKAQDKLTREFLGEVEGRDEFREYLTSLWNVERYGIPSAEGGRYFFRKNDGLQNQSVLYTSESLSEEPRVLLDPNELSGDGTVSLGRYEVSPDGKLMAYAVSKSGSDWQEWRVREVESGKDRDDRLEWSKFSGASWSKDSSGFYYGKFPEPTEGKAFSDQNTDQRIYFHRLGEDQAKDRLVYARSEFPKESPYGGLTDDGRYLIIYIVRGTSPKNGLFYRDLTKPDSEVVELLPDFDASYSLIDYIGSTFYIQTDLDAPKQRLIAIDIEKPERENWKTVIPEAEEALRGVSHVGGVFIASYLKDARSEIRRFSVEGQKLEAVKLPGIGTVSGFRGRAGDEETFYYFTSFTQPGAIYRYEVKSNQSTLFKAPEVKFDPEKYESKQVFTKSKDGTRVPMFIVHRKGVKLEGENPTLLYGYGGFNVSLQPVYSPSIIAWMDLGGIYVMANLRGGGEYGVEWHEAGMLGNKQNVFDDFISCAEYLVEEKFTSSTKLAISGGSNGGLLVGACLVQRPELFGAGLPAVGVMDMLRYHKFTIGWAWESEFGSADDPEQFKNLLGYSPYHNLKKGEYPATMVTTSDHDDRVVPWHSYKFAAALQYAQQGSDATLIRIEQKSGHGAGTPTSKQIEAVVDKYSFLSRALGFPLKVRK